MHAGVGGWVVGAAAGLLSAGCNICGPDHRSVLTYADNGFTVTRGSGAPSATTLNGALYDSQASERTFAAIWDVFDRGARPYTGAAVTMTGGSANQMVGLVLALPTPVQGDRHVTVSGTFPPPNEPYVMYWNAWGAHPLASTGSAEIALRVSDFSPTGGPSNPFVATAASGSIDVTETEANTFRLDLDITATGAGGETVRLRGPVVVRLQRESATCFS